MSVRRPDPIHHPRCRPDVVSRHARRPLAHRWTPFDPRQEKGVYPPPRREPPDPSRSVWLEWRDQLVRVREGSTVRGSSTPWSVGAGAFSASSRRPSDRRSWARTPRSPRRAVPGSPVNSLALSPPLFSKRNATVLPTATPVEPTTDTRSDDDLDVHRSGVSLPRPVHCSPTVPARPNSRVSPGLGSIYRTCSSPICSTSVS